MVERLPFHVTQHLSINKTKKGPFLTPPAEVGWAIFDGTKEVKPSPSSFRKHGLVFLAMLVLNLKPKKKQTVKG